MKHQKVATSAATAANGIELGTAIIRGVVNDTAHGEFVDSLDNLFTIELNAELERKGANND